MLTISHSMIVNNIEVFENGGRVIFNTNGTVTITNGGLWTGDTGSARGKSAGTYRGAIGKTGRGTPLDFVLAAEGAPFEGRGVPPTAEYLCAYLCLDYVSTYPE